MQKLVRSLVGAATLFGGVSAHGAYLYFLYGTHKSFMQTAPFANDFDGGEFHARIIDGNYVILVGGCQASGGPNPFAPGSEMGRCPIGSTGFVVSGDLNGDGVRDDLSYYQVTNIVPAQLIAPFLPTQAVLKSVPAGSQLAPAVGKTGMRGFVDDSVMLFYNFLDYDLYQYTLTRYIMDREYPINIGLMNADFPDGGYSFLFPNVAGSQSNISGTITPFIEQYISKTQGGYNLRFRFTNSGQRWSAGALELDPRVVNTFTWQGTTTGGLRSTDRAYFSVYDATQSFSIFPPSGARVRIPVITNTSVALPNYFFTIGQEGVVALQYERGNTLASTVQEWSTRDFRMKVRFVNLYEGYANTVLPADTPAAKRAPAGDADGDGFSNITEFAYKSDLTNKDAALKDTPNADTATFKVTPTGVAAIRTVTVTKRTDAGNSLIYGFEISVNGGVTFTKITNASAATHAGWTLTQPETATTWEVKSNASIPANAIIRPYAEQRAGY